MPGLSGDALTKLIVGSKDTTDPIIVLHSAAEPSQLEQLSNSCGATGWIEKTSDPRAFLMRFTQIVAKRAERRSRQTLPRSRAGERTHT
jgi:response regulator RpfG family c-di-GMP phosphodiesterase